MALAYWAVGPSGRGAGKTAVAASERRFMVAVPRLLPAFFNFLTDLNLRMVRVVVVEPRFDFGDRERLRPRARCFVVAMRRRIAKSGGKMQMWTMGGDWGCLN